jgi:hypothetical protein
MKPFSASNHTKQYLRDLLELAKQRMLSRIPTNPTDETNETNVTSSQLSTSSSSYAIEQVLMNANIAEIVLGVGYVLIIIAFLVKRLLKTLRQFETHYGSSHDGAYNRFGFIANEDSDYDSDSSDNHSHENNVDDDDIVGSSSSSSPVSLRHALIPLITPLEKITTVTPHTPFPPPVRRSLRLKIKSELNLTSIIEKQNKTNVLTNVVTRSQTQRRNQRLAVSSEPAPSSSFNLSHNGSVTNPSLHPENDEELAYYLQRCYERNMKKRSDVNSPLLVRRLVL